MTWRAATSKHVPISSLRSVEAEAQSWDTRYGNNQAIRSTSYECVYIYESESENEVTQSCPTLCDPMDCSLPGSSVHGIFQAIVLEWVAISFSRGSSWPRDRTRVSCIVDRRFTVWATGEVPYKLKTQSIQFSHSVVSDSLRPHGLQHARLPCPSPTPRACSNSCPSSWWCHPTISASVVLFSLGSSHLKKRAQFHTFVFGALI